MAQEPIPGRLSYRLLNPDTGAVVVPDLPHLHQSTWTVRGLQQGIPGSATIGDLAIPIPPADSKEYKRNKDLYDLVIATPGLRVEGCVGDRVNASPRFTGVATKVRPGFGRWDIIGSDSLWWLQQSQLFPGEVVGVGSTTVALLNALRSTREIAWDDDFSNWDAAFFGKHSSLDYTNSGWSFTAADPQFGQPALTATTSGSRVVSHATWSPTAGEFNWPSSFALAASMVTIQGTLIASNDTSDAGDVEVLWNCDATVQNGYLARALMRQTGVGSGLWNVDLNIFTVAAGVFTSVASAANVLTNLSSTIGFELSVVLYNVGGNHVARVLINGKDGGCVYSFNTAPAPASGGVGVRFGFSGGAPTAYVNRLRFESRPVPVNWGSARFGPGNISAGVTLPQSIVSNGQTHLDMGLLVSTLDGFWIRKNPGAGYRADTLDYSATPGTDLTNQVVFEEGVNLDMSGTQVLPVSDLFSKSTKVNAVPGFDSGGSVTWSALQNTGDMVLIDTVSDLGVPGYILLAAYARLIAARKANPLQCIQLSVIRTADTAEKWRELDYVTAILPSLGIQRQKAQIVGYTYTEGSALQTVWLNQFPDHFVQGQLQRIARSLEWIGGIISPR